jgi:hypothetical protein
MGLKKHTQFINKLPYWVDLTETHTRAEHVVWLGINIGGYKTLWDFSGPNRLTFAREQDRMMFILRWA